MFIVLKPLNLLIKNKGIYLYIYIYTFIFVQLCEEENGF